MNISEDYYVGLQETTQELRQSLDPSIEKFSNSLDFVVDLAYINRLGRPVGSSEEFSFLALDELKNFFQFLRSQRITDDSKEILLKQLEILESKYDEHPTTPLIAKAMQYAIMPLKDNFNQNFNELTNIINSARDKNNEYRSHITYHKEVDIKIRQHINSTREMDILLDSYSANLKSLDTFEQYEKTNVDLIDSVEFYLFGEIPSILSDLQEKDFNLVKPYLKPLGKEIKEKLEKRNLSFSQKRLNENEAYFNNNFRYQNKPFVKESMNDLIQILKESNTRLQY
jgi:hypothetical protein